MKAILAAHHRSIVIATLLYVAACFVLKFYIKPGSFGEVFVGSIGIILIVLSLLSVLAKHQLKRRLHSYREDWNG